jgi:hypothetical protein
MNSELRRYLIDCINPENYDENPETDQEKIAWLKQTFESEKREKIGDTEFYYRSALKDWLQGLPSALDIPYERLVGVAFFMRKFAGYGKPQGTDDLFDDYYYFMADKLMELFKEA